MNKRDAEGKKLRKNDYGDGRLIIRKRSRIVDATRPPIMAQCERADNHPETAATRDPRKRPRAVGGGKYVSD